MGPVRKLPRHNAAGAMLATILLLSGCASVDPNVALTEEAVTAISVGEAADVSAYELAKAMLRAGFSRDQILKHGPKVRNALATSGGAQMRDGKFVGALFSVHSGNLYVTSRTRGTLVQPLGSDKAEGSLVLKAPR